MGSFHRSSLPNPVQATPHGPCHSIFILIMNISEKSSKPSLHPLRALPPPRPLLLSRQRLHQIPKSNSQVFFETNRLSSGKGIRRYPARLGPRVTRWTVRRPPVHRSYRCPVQMKVRIAASCPVNLLLSWEKEMISGWRLTLRDGRAQHGPGLCPLENVGSITVKMLAVPLPPAPVT